MITFRFYTFYAVFNSHSHFLDEKKNNERYSTYSRYLPGTDGIFIFILIL